MKVVSFDKAKFFQKADFYERRAHMTIEKLSLARSGRKNDGTLERDC